MRTIALIGNGHWGSKILKYANKYFNVKYIANSKFNKDIIWYDKEVEGVIIATPIDTHFEIARDAILAGKHVFVEKPITDNSSQAIKLRELALACNVNIGVDYIYTVSRSISKARGFTFKIGEIEYIEILLKKLGTVSKYNVYWLLASHCLSILDMFIPLDKIKTFDNTNILYHNNICTNGYITFDNGIIDVDLNSPNRQSRINIYGKCGTIKINLLSEPNLIESCSSGTWTYSFDESNNLDSVMLYFEWLMSGHACSNIEQAIKITSILEDIDA